MTTIEHTPTVANILRVYRSATPGQVADGMAWYDEAHSLALALDPVNPLRAAGVISALSPRVTWGQNMKDAVRAFADGRATKTMGQKIQKANAILDGADVAKTLKAPKTVNFARVIANPADPHAVVVDGHAFDIAVGQVTNDDARTQLARKGEYDRFADLYREAARRAGVSPSQMQAITWVVWRETAIRNAAANRLAANR